MLWSYFPGLTMFEFINQYHFFLSEKPFPTSHTSCKIKLQRLFFALVLKRDPKLHINHILECTSHVLQLRMYFITWHQKSNPLSGKFIYTVDKSNGILLLTDHRKTNKSIFDMKQSVVSIGSQYTLVSQSLCER